MSEGLVLGDKKISFLPITWKLALAIWWAFTWRGILLVALPTYMAVFLVGVVITKIAIYKNGLIITKDLEFIALLKLIAQTVGIFMSTFLSVWLVKDMFNKKFKRFRIVIIPNNANVKID